MSHEATGPSSLGVEEIIATISVLILAAIFIGYYLWPESSATPEAAYELPASTATTRRVPFQSTTTVPLPASEAPLKQNISISGKGDSGSMIGVEINGNLIDTARINSTGKWEVDGKTDRSNDLTINLSSKAIREVPANAEKQAPTSPNSESTVETEIGHSTQQKAESNQEVHNASAGESASLADINEPQTPVQTAKLSAERAEPTPSTPPATAAPATQGIEISDPVITFLDRDRTTNELIISGTTPKKTRFVVLLINGTTTKPVKTDAQNKWRYRFKAGPGEYYVRVTPATEKGPVIRVDALPTLYNISLAPIASDSSEAGAEISLLSGEFITIGAGETLSQVSKQSGIKVDDLKLVNGIAKNASVKEGDVLFIPTGQ